MDNKNFLNNFLNKNLLPDDTPEGQRRAVNSDKKIITVGAGAGTGKTWVLSNRYARLLLSSDDILPRDILTLTYTEAAANEMKRRIEERVIKILDDKNFNNFNNISSERKNAIIDGFGEAWISTIHSFAARIIHESGLALDIDPKAAVISAPQEENFWNGITQAVEFGNLRGVAYAYGNSKLRNLAKELDEDKCISAAVGRWGAGTLSLLARRTSELHASLGRDFNDFLDFNNFNNNKFNFIDNTREILTPIMHDYWLKVFHTWNFIFDELRDIITQKGEKALDEGKNNSNLLLFNCMNKFYAIRKKTNKALSEFYYDIVLDKRLKSHGREPFQSVKEMLGGITLGDWRKKFPDINVNHKFSQAELKFHASLIKFCALSWGLWDSMKRRRGLLSFSDMILHAFGSIKARENLSGFKYILVDEFQDTDPLQFNLINLIKDLTSGFTGLFAVGDPKQSIYSFRHAEPELFAKTIDGADEKIELDVSFRTRPELLERINDLFENIWANGLGSSEAMTRLKFQKVSSARDKAGNIPAFSVMLYENLENLDANEKNKNAAEIRTLLARALARRILYFVNNGYTVWDKATGELRPVKFNDFAVLVRVRTPYEALEQAFSAEGVPSIQDLSRNYFSRGEVGDIINLLRAAADKNDGASIAGWLASPFSGVERAAALKYIENAALKKLNIYDALPAEIKNNLDLIANIGLREGPAELIAIFDRDRRWLKFYKEDELLRVIRNLRSAMSLARSFQSGDALSLTACADWMAQAVRRSVDMEEPSWHDPDENGVLFTTIYKSKGLEYPVTIIFDEVSNFGGGGGDKSALKTSKELGVIFSDLPDELKPNNNDEKFETLAAWNKFLLKRGKDEEDMRLFYVAATRAQDALIICGAKNMIKNKNSWTGLFLNRMIERGECTEDLNGENIFIVHDNLFDDKNLDNKNNKKLVNKNDINILYSHTALPDKKYKKFLSLNELSATSFALYEWCPLAWRMRYRQGLDLKYAVNKNNNAPRSENLNITGGAEIGSLAHWLLSRNNFNNLNNNLEFNNTRDKIPYYLRAVWDNEKSREAVFKILNDFASSDAYLILKEAAARKDKNNFKREANFRINFNNIILTGAMDVVWHDGGIWHVMDYKTTLSEHAPDELYKSQLEFYALVLREAAVLNNAVFNKVEAGIIYLRENGAVKNWKISGWDNLRQRVLKAAHECVAGDFQANLNNCSACPWKGDCLKYKPL